MTELSLAALRDIGGYVAAALIDIDSGMLLIGDGTGVDLDIAADGNAEVIKRKRDVAAALDLGDRIEDVLITLGRQYHLLRPLETNASVMVYLVLRRESANLAMARHQLRTFEKSLDFGAG